MTKRRKIKRLSPDQKKAVWAKTEANAGAGWEAFGGNDADPRAFEHGVSTEFNDLPLDDPEELSRFEG